MHQGTRRTATALTAAALGVVVVSGAVLGTRDVTAALEPDVAAAVQASAPGQVGVEVSGREVTLDPWSAPDAVVARAVAAVEAVPGVRSVRVRPVEVGAGGPEAATGDVDLSLRVTGTGVAFSSAVPSRALADGIGRRVAQVRGVPVAVDLAVDTTLPAPRWWPGLSQVLDSTAQVDDLRLDVRDGVLTVRGTTTSAAAAERIGREVEAVDLVDDVVADIIAGPSAGLDPDQAEVLEEAVVPFDVGSSVIGPRGAQALDRVAAVLRATDVSLDVLGHAGPADPQRGDTLAVERAGAVRDALVARGVPADRLVATPVGSSADRGIDPLSPQYRKVDFRVEEER